MKFTLRFIRFDDAEDSNHALNDDVAEIQCVGPDFYELTYKCTNTTAQPITTKHLLTGDAVFKWMRSVIGMLELDGDPFSNLQISMTGFPDILLRVAQKGAEDSLKYYIGRAYNRLLDLTEFYLTNAPLPPRAPWTAMDEEEGEIMDDRSTLSESWAARAEPVVRTHTFFH
jgi:hypothetical protein